MTGRHTIYIDWRPRRWLTARNIIIRRGRKHLKHSYMASLEAGMCQLNDNRHVGRGSDALQRPSGRGFRRVGPELLPGGWTAQSNYFGRPPAKVP
jgi:hypothetical protein